MNSCPKVQMVRGLRMRSYTPPDAELEGLHGAVVAELWPSRSPRAVTSAIRATNCLRTQKNVNTLPY